MRMYLIKPNTFYYHEPVNCHKGGVALHIKDDLYIYERNDLVIVEGGWTMFGLRL